MESSETFRAPRVWDADAELSPEQAKCMITARFPDLAFHSLTLLGAGWDNTAFLVDERLVFRFPRRKMAAGLIERERRILPMLAPMLPLPIPQPIFNGQPGEDYPYYFSGYLLLPGTTACHLEWTDAQRTECAVVLASFLASLHGVPVDAETRNWAPGDELRRADLEKRVPQVIARLKSLAPRLKNVDVSAVLTAVQECASASPWSDLGCWVHGDLYARHLLADDTHKLSGIIDWGDIHLGDRAVDLSIAFSFLPPAARTGFCNAYGPTDDATWKRAQFRAIHYGAILFEYGLDVGDTALQSAGIYALQAATEGE